MNENVFYTKSKRRVKMEQNQILSQLNASTKLHMNWDLVSKLHDINQVFKNNPCGLDAFLTVPAKNVNAKSNNEIQTKNMIHKFLYK